MNRRFSLLICFCALLVLMILVGTCGTQPVRLSQGKTLEMFPLANSCIDCHDNIHAPDGSHYSFVADWQQSLHALSAVDPLFLAVARSETMILPAAGDLIQTVCAGCHLPMADLAAVALGKSRSFLDYATVPGNEFYEVYQDGISCMICHQLTEEPIAGNTNYLGSRLSIDLTPPRSGQVRNLYGYHQIGEEGQRSKMEALGYRSVQSDAGRKSIICSVCHTLYTDSFTIEGQPTGTQLPEQVVFFEWLSSSLADQSCQSCHMPVITNAGPLSNEKIADPVLDRIGSHFLDGVNFYMLEMLGGIHGPFDDGIAVIADLLQNRTATVTASGTLGQQGGSNMLALDVRIDSITGHKFPTGFPSRRAWLHVKVQDENNSTIYESGAYLNNGMIVDNANDLTKGAFEPHYEQIDQPGQVQIYEAVMIDSTGKATTNLLQGVTYGKDNRLLPPGFSKTSVPPDIAVVGDALNDRDFIGGSDITRYRIALPGTVTRAAVTVELLFQPIGYRFLENLKDYPSAEQAALAGLVARTPNTPMVIDGTQLTITR